MKFHWPLFIIVTFGICLIFSVFNMVHAAPRKDVKITQAIGDSPADEEAFKEYMYKYEEQQSVYDAPPEDIGSDIESEVGGEMGQNLSETLLPGSDTDETGLPVNWESEKNSN